MISTQYPFINSLIKELFLDIQKVLGDKLVGFYLEGSLVLGDFDEKISDIDLLAALSSDVNDNELDQLRNMHANFVKKYKEYSRNAHRAQHYILLKLNKHKHKYN